MRYIRTNRSLSVSLCLSFSHSLVKPKPSDCRFKRTRAYSQREFQNESNRLVSVICLYDAHYIFLASSSDALIQCAHCILIGDFQAHIIIEKRFDKFGLHFFFDSKNSTVEICEKPIKVTQESEKKIGKSDLALRCPRGPFCVRATGYSVVKCVEMSKFDVCFERSLWSCQGKLLYSIYKNNTHTVSVRKKESKTE